MISYQERISHLMDIIKNAHQELKYLLSSKSKKSTRMIEESELIKYQAQQSSSRKEIIQLGWKTSGNSSRNYVQFEIDGQVHEVSVIEHTTCPIITLTFQFLDLKPYKLDAFLDTDVEINLCKWHVIPIEF